MNAIETPSVGKTYGISLPSMIDRIVWAMEDAFYPEEPVDSRTLRLTVIEFMNVHGDDAVIGLYGFIRYIQTSDKADEEKLKAIKQVLSHDINGRKDKFMIPRSSSYKEYAKR